VSVSISVKNQIVDLIEAVMYHPHFTSQQSHILLLVFFAIRYVTTSKNKKL